MVAAVVQDRQLVQFAFKIYVYCLFIVYTQLAVSCDYMTFCKHLGVELVENLSLEGMTSLFPE